MKGGGELDPRMNNFYVEMDASNMHSMNIPKKFAKILKGSVREIVELEGPSGITWIVKVIMSKSNNTFAFQSGWNDFVTANRIDKNDKLVFTYNGNSSFKVVIFDPSGCQKAAPFFAKKTETETESDQDSSAREIVARHCEVKKEIISLSSGSSDSTDESSREISSRATRAHMTEEMVCCKRKRKDFVQELSESESDQSDDGEHGTVRKRKTKENIRAEKASGLYVIPHKTHLSEAQEEIANEMARKTQKGSDLFVKILTPVNTHTHRDCMLRLPSRFARKVLQNEKKKINLVPADLDDRSKICTAKYSKTKSMMRYIGPGWRKFVCRNELKQGDICLFELKKQEKREILTMIVHFNRVSN